MSGSHTHPRRSFIPSSPGPASPHALNRVPGNLHRGETFHSSTRLASDLFDPLSEIGLAPHRSYSNIEDLSDLVTEIDEHRVADRLRDDRQTLPSRGISNLSVGLTRDREIPPLPGFLLDHMRLPNTPASIVEEPRTKSIHEQNHSHASDSGLGSSISGTRISGSLLPSDTSTSAVTKSAHTSSLPATPMHLLSKHAADQIDKLIIKPILAKKALKQCHPLVKSVPFRIERHAIRNLRDLEKTLILLAPNFTTLHTTYREFCEISVRCIRDTVPTLGEADQRLPADRPYSNSYFLDLVEQIRKYAAIMAHTREKLAKGEKLDETDYHPDEKITLQGGVTQTGHPLELVRQKNGKNLPIASDAERASAKRSLPAELDGDEGLRRGLPRCKGSPSDSVMHACSYCTKEFQRRCDVTKHEKTHSRPHKCAEEGCRYHTYGWPTLKELERHFNDKHKDSPTLYPCQYCSYVSKRESNCKQHMEKLHDWHYARSKRNGKKRTDEVTPSPADLQVPTPVSTSKPSPAASRPSPMTVDASRQPQDPSKLLVDSMGVPSSQVMASPFPPFFDFDALDTTNAMNSVVGRNAVGVGGQPTSVSPPGTSDSVLYSQNFAQQPTPTISVGDVDFATFQPANSPYSVVGNGFHPSPQGQVFPYQPTEDPAGPVSAGSSYADFPLFTDETSAIPNESSLLDAYTNLDPATDGANCYMTYPS